MPMSLSSYNGKGVSSITLKPWGVGSADLVKMKYGAMIGIRGPYGEPFTVNKCKALLVGGGTGLAPLMPLARELIEAGSKVTIVIGGRTKADLLFEKRASSIVRRENLFVTTDDGSHGVKGFPTDIAEDLIVKKGITRVYTCGPEVMMRKLYDIATRAGIKCEASLERGMKCGIGICGSCTVGPYLLCRDGPVLKRQQLELVSDEFGLLQRDHSGRYVAV
jgi:dihydroorotate dehydrogenase electron transfer subunit